MTALLCEDVMMNTVKNSTLLDHSHAQDLALQQPPNLSSILEKEQPVKCRKVTFSDIVSIRNVSSHKRGGTDQQDSGVKPGEASGRVPARSRDASSRHGKFFDFADETEREAFFQRLKRTLMFKFPAKPITQSERT
ncbi:hypothetical protein cypCar_00003464 [Cyprinus carpio]|nr:hypothetical protein cypCar_00003464 [Cyprinus carpio]